MKSRTTLRRVRRVELWAGRLLLAGILCLEVWFIGRFASEWPRLTGSATAQVYAIDVGSAFGAR